MSALHAGDKTAIKKYIVRVFGKDAPTAIAVFTAESHLNCNAVGDGHLTFENNGIEYGASYGVAQIRYLAGRPTPEQLKDCKFNIDYSHTIFIKQHFKPWSMWLNKQYLKYLRTITN